MGLFGWSLPPGCGELPGEVDYPCEVCCLMPDNCICPECEECGEVGRESCYRDHGLIRSAEQFAAAAIMEQKWKEEAEREAAFWEQYAKEEHLEEH